MSVADIQARIATRSDPIPELLDLVGGSRRLNARALLDPNWNTNGGLALVGYELAEVSGDGDGRWQAGEVFEVQPIIANTMGVPTAGLSVQLASVPTNVIGLNAGPNALPDAAANTRQTYASDLNLQVGPITKSELAETEIILLQDGAEIDRLRIRIGLSARPEQVVWTTNVGMRHMLADQQRNIIYVSEPLTETVRALDITTMTTLAIAELGEKIHRRPSFAGHYQIEAPTRLTQSVDGQYLFAACNRAIHKLRLPDLTPVARFATETNVLDIIHLDGDVLCFSTEQLDDKLVRLDATTGKRLLNLVRSYLGYYDSLLRRNPVEIDSM